MLRCKNIASSLNVKNVVVVTFDEVLYYKTKELEWLNKELCGNFVIRLGGFHAMLNFIKVIGQRLEGSGFADIIFESGVYTSNT